MENIIFKLHHGLSLGFTSILSLGHLNTSICFDWNHSVSIGCIFRIVVILESYAGHILKSIEASKSFSPGLPPIKLHPSSNQIWSKKVNSSVLHPLTFLLDIIFRVICCASFPLHLLFWIQTKRILSEQNTVYHIMAKCSAWLVANCRWNLRSNAIFRQQRVF